MCMVGGGGKGNSIQKKRHKIPWHILAIRISLVWLGHGM